jgi:hypothetical protein
MNGNFKPMTYLEKYYSYFLNNITKKEHRVIDNFQLQQNNVFFHNKLKKCKGKISKIISNDKKIRHQMHILFGPKTMMKCCKI